MAKRKAKSDKPQVYVMIQWSSRGMDDAPMKFTIDLELIERALALPDDAMRDDFMEDNIVKNFDIAAVLGSFLKPNLIAQWNEKKSVGDIEEEFTWGMALTKVGAKAAFADAMNDAMGGDDDWGDEE